MATDYTTECGSSPLSFLQMLASSIVGYQDLAGVTHYRINTLIYSVECNLLSDFLDCNLTHIEPERALVENTFALDDCGEYLAWKVINNLDKNWLDYDNCGEIPQSFIRMLYRSIVTLAGHNKINAIFDTDDCDELTPLLDCVTNQIESERLLVTNLFGVDSCDRMLIKVFNNTSTMTDYHTECVDMAQSFYQMLARCIVEYDGHYYLNVALVTNYCDDLLPFWTCALNHIEPERALVENVFATDSCGNLALKLFYNLGEERPQ